MERNSVGVYHGSQRVILIKFLPVELTIFYTINFETNEKYRMDVTSGRHIRKH